MLHPPKGRPLIDVIAIPLLPPQIEALTSNCVPLHIDDNVSRYFEELLPYDTFEVRRAMRLAFPSSWQLSNCEERTTAAVNATALAAL